MVALIKSDIPTAPPSRKLSGRRNPFNPNVADMMPREINKVSLTILVALIRLTRISSSCRGVESVAVCGVSMGVERYGLSGAKIRKKQRHFYFPQTIFLGQPLIRKGAALSGTFCFIPLRLQHLHDLISQIALNQDCAIFHRSAHTAF